MKTILKILVITLAIFLIPTSGYSQTHTSQKKTQNNTRGDTLSFTVYGMDCPGCAGGLEKQVNKIPSIEFSEANWVKQELKVVVKQDSTLNIDELKKRVKKANFTLITNAKEEENEE